MPSPLDPTAPTTPPYPAGVPSTVDDFTHPDRIQSHARWWRLGEILDAKIARLLGRPLIARVDAPEPEARSSDATPRAGGFAHDGNDAFLAAIAHELGRTMIDPVQVAHNAAWTTHPDGTCTVRIAIDYGEAWRGREKEVLETVRNTIEGEVVLLTREQRNLLVNHPLQFLALQPRPVTAELVSWVGDRVSGAERVVALTFAEPPEQRAAYPYVAIVPNLVPLERQKRAAQLIGSATDPQLGSLAALLGDLVGGATLFMHDAPRELDPNLLAARDDEKLDEFQLACVQKAVTSPHFAVIHGPPGSGKTTVISATIRRLLEAGERVLVASPTHVAVDNVVEKLTTPGQTDMLEARSLPVRFASRPSRLSRRAGEYWVGPRDERRGATIAKRVEAVLCNAPGAPDAVALFARVDPKLVGVAPLTNALTRVERVVCGTPLGLPSHPALRNAAPGAFDTLIIDEASKLTVAEFAAIAIYAKRWVVVGDAAQLPPYNDTAENGEAVATMFPPQEELVCSVAAFLERQVPHGRAATRLIVATHDPHHVWLIAKAHLRECGLGDLPPFEDFSAAVPGGVVFCAPDEVETVAAAAARQRSSRHVASPRVLWERTLTPRTPADGRAWVNVEERERAPARILEVAFNTYHAQPWSTRARHRLRLTGTRNGLAAMLPTEPVADFMRPTLLNPMYEAPTPDELARRIGELYALATVSVLDWLTGIATDVFDVAPLTHVPGLVEPELVARVAPYVGTLRRQYRMAAAISRVPRELFYFDEALHDGNPEHAAAGGVRLVQVDAPSEQGERNASEVAEVTRIVRTALELARRTGSKATLMVITPYCAQERAIRDALEPLAREGDADLLDVEIATLDRCQGREADYVVVSLVRSRATPFLDMPKRWNVALTRAMRGLFLVGDIASYLAEADRALEDARRRYDGRPSMSLLARIVHAYAHAPTTR